MTTSPSAADGLLARLFSRRAAMMLVRNTVVGCTVFLIGLALLWACVEKLGMEKHVAAGLSFLVANSIHYGFGRLWIFAGSRRALAPGYAYFLVNAGVGLVVTVALFALFADVVGLHYLVARIVASVFAGLVIFVLNAVLNFRVL